MKKFMILIIAVVCLAIASCTHIYKPITRSEKADSVSAANGYRLHELIVIYKRKPTPAAAKKIKRRIAARKINIRPLEVKKCNGCNEYVELWYAKDIHRFAADSIPGGTVSNKAVNGAGEDGLAYYSLNFLNSIAIDTTLRFKTFNQNAVDFSGENKDTIRVAVLDTGLDSRVVSPNLQWKNPNETENEKDDDGNCYADDTHGWNFINDNSDVNDNNVNMHGTLISHYIINEFARSSKNFVQIMSLKTLDERGYGDLFSNICALHYAVNKGANIINASWGFYHYKQGQPHPYLDNLITKTIREKGVLFVTAAGNKDEEADKLAREAYKEKYGLDISDAMLRNLEYHSYYPACLSRQGKNVVTVTTTDGTVVGPTQNYSEEYVDIGVMGEVDDAPAMRFKTPFPGTNSSISGSSYATAIACGKIGAYFPKSMYVPGLNKDAVFEQLRAITPEGRPTLITYETVLEKSFIKQGKKTYIE